MLLLTYLANRKWFKKPQKSLKPWQMGTHPKELSECYPLNSNMTGFRCFQTSLCPCVFDKSSLSIGRVKAQLPQEKMPTKYEHSSLSWMYNWSASLYLIRELLISSPGSFNSYADGGYFGHFGIFLLLSIPNPNAQKFLKKLSYTSMILTTITLEYRNLWQTIWRRVVGNVLISICSSNLFHTMLSPVRWNISSKLSGCFWLLWALIG